MGKERLLRRIDEGQGAAAAASGAISGVTSTAANITNADTVDGFNASATPIAGWLVALGADGKFPASVIPTPSGGSISDFPGGLRTAFIEVYRTQYGAADSPWINALETWAGGGTKTGIKYHAQGVAGSDFATGSALLDLWLNNASKFKVQQDGALTSAAGGTFGGAVAVDHASAVVGWEYKRSGARKYTWQLATNNWLGLWVDGINLTDPNPGEGGGPYGYNTNAKYAITVAPSSGEVMIGHLDPSWTAAGPLHIYLDNSDTDLVIDAGIPARPRASFISFAKNRFPGGTQSALVWNLGRDTDDTFFLTRQNQPYDAQTHFLVTHPLTNTGSYPNWPNIYTDFYRWKWTANNTGAASQAIELATGRIATVAMWDENAVQRITIPTEGDVIFNQASGGLQVRGGGIKVNDASTPALGQITARRTSGSQIKLEYDSTKVAELTVDSGGNLTAKTPATVGGDWIWDIGSAAATIRPNLNYSHNLGSLTKKYLTLHAAELWVETLVAQDTVATIGGRVIIAPTTQLVQDLGTAVDGSGNTTAVVKHNQMQVGDIVVTQAGGAVEWMRVESGPTGSAGSYSYVLRRNLDGTGINSWSAGDAVVNTGATGSGFIDLYSLESAAVQPLDHIYNYDFNGGSPIWSTNHAQSSNWPLWHSNYLTLSAEDAIYFGKLGTTWENLHFQLATAGSFNFTLNWEYWNGSAWTAFSPTVTPAGASFLRTAGLNSATWTASALTGWAVTTANGVSAYWVRLRISNVVSIGAVPVVGGRRVYHAKGQLGPTVVMYRRESATFNDFTERSALGRLTGLYDYTADTYGTAFGKYHPSAASSWIGVDDTNGIRIVRRNAGSNTVLGQWDTSGNIRVGRSTAPHVYIDANGAVRLRNNAGTDTIVLDETGASFFAGPMTIGASGGIFQGTGTFASPTTGLKLWNAGGIGRIAGYNAAAEQWSADTNGYLTAGGGVVRLASDGLTIGVPFQTGGFSAPAAPERIRFHGYYSGSNDPNPAIDVYTRNYKVGTALSSQMFVHLNPADWNPTAPDAWTAEGNSFRIVHGSAFTNVAEFATDLIRLRKPTRVHDYVSLTDNGRVTDEANRTDIRLKTIATLLNNGTGLLPFVTGNGAGTKGLALISSSNGAATAAIILGGTLNATYIAFDPQAGYSVTAGTAGRTNVYWSSANSRYEIENKTGQTQTYNVTLFVGS